MSLAVIMPNRNSEDLVQALAERLPGETIVQWPDIQCPESVTFAVLWKQPPGVLAQLPGLNAVMSYGAGADFILEDPDLPAAIPVARTVTSGLISEMREHVLALVLSERRRLPQYAADQRVARWNPGYPALGHRVAILGLGSLGLPAAEGLTGLGFEVSGFSRTRPERWDGNWFPLGELTEHAGEMDFVISLLPLTADTRGCLNQQLFASMKAGSCLINVSRGELLNEPDLLQALAQGRPGSACLDVFNNEPLPPGHPFWDHEQVRVTPHVAALTDPQQAADCIAHCFRLARQGHALPFLAR